MAGRIRTIKPGFFTSPATAKASHKARLLYAAMWCWADDYGVGETNINGLLGFTFPDDDEIDRKELQSLLSEVACAFDVVFYKVGGRAYYEVLSWDEHQRTQRRADRRHPSHTHEDAVPDLRFCKQGISEEKLGSSAQSQGKSLSGIGEQGNRGTGEDDDASVVEVVAPEYIDNPRTPTKRYPSSAAKTVVRQTLPGYPRTTVDRLAVQVDKLAHEGHPDILIREALTEWERRPNCNKPEFLATVLGDVVKSQRASPVSSGDAKVQDWLNLANNPHLKAIGE